MHLDIISAGAGSGKTYTLTHRIHQYIKAGTVKPEHIIATTFTQKAAAELRERIKIKLLEEGMVAQSEAIDLSLIGTVHSIGTRILQRFAFEAGYSPLVEIIPEDEAATMFNYSISRILTVEVTEQLNRLTLQLGLTGGNDSDTNYDWRKDLKQLIDLIRLNDLDANGIAESKKRSWQRIESMLYQPTPEEAATLPSYADAWLSRLAGLLATTIETIEQGSDETAKTITATDTCRSALHTIKSLGVLPWHDWARISKLSFAKKSEAIAEPLISFAGCVEAHPTLREELKAYVTTLFDLAQEAIQEFQLFKKKRGAIDYSDMEVMLASVLDDPHVRSVLASETDLLMVDEFQDTSPIQLSIFLKLSALAKKSIWVGDPKQSIYGFRGAEPALMQAVIEATGGVKDENILKKSFRSRTDLVHSVNAIFVGAFPELPAEQICLEVGRKDEMPDLPKALKHWRLLVAEDENKKPKNKTWTQMAIAQKVAMTLEEGLLVKPKGANQWQPIRPGDMAILCRSNAECLEIAKALTEAGLKVALTQNGLNATTEGKLLTAALRYLVDRSDSLSVAELLILTDQMSLPQLIEHRLEHLKPKAYDLPKVRWATDQPFIAQLDEMRRQIRDLSASEIIEKLLTEIDFGQILARFGNVDHRMANLDQFRQSAAVYETTCTRMQAAASLGGLLLWLEKQANSGKDAQSSAQNPDSVNVLTYHKSKGLEYPLVVCYSLDKALKDRFWGFAVCQDSAKPDLNHILANRYVEFRVHPFGKQIKSTRMDTAVQNSEIFRSETVSARAEDTRVLYVGLTRARDYLVIPTTVAPSSWLNRVFNQDDTIPTLQPDTSETPFYYPKNASEPVICSLEVERFSQSLDLTTELPPFELWLSPRAGKQVHDPRIIDVQHEGVDDVRLRQILPTWHTYPAPVLDLSDGDALEALAGLILAEQDGMTTDNRLKLAQKRAQIYGSAVDAQDLMLHSLALQPLFGQGEDLGAMPVHLVLNGRTLSFTLPKVIKNSGSILSCSIETKPDTPKSKAAQAFQQQAIWSLMTLGQAFPGQNAKVVLICPEHQGYWEWIRFEA